MNNLKVGDKVYALDMDVYKIDEYTIKKIKNNHAYLVNRLNEEHMVGLKYIKHLTEITPFITTNYEFFYPKEKVFSLMVCKLTYQINRLKHKIKNLQEIRNTYME